MATHDKPAATPGGSSDRGVVVPFPQRRPADNRLTSRDVLLLHDWLDLARQHGVVAYKIEEWENGEDPRMLGSFALIYREHREWASWSIARSNGLYQVWETGFGRTLGVFDDLQAALALLSSVAEAEALKQSSIRDRHARLRAAGKGSRSGDAGANCRQHAAG